MRQNQNTSGKSVLILAAGSRKYPEIRIFLLINRGQPRQFLSGRNPSVSASPIQLPLHKGADNNFICENKNAVILHEELRRYWHISASAHPPRPQAKSPPHSECRGLNFVFCYASISPMRPGVAPAALDSSVSMCIASAYFGLTLTTTSPKTSERPLESILTLTICLS